MSHYVLGCLVENREVELAMRSLKKFFKDEEESKEDLRGYAANYFAKKMLKPYDENLSLDEEDQYTREELINIGKDFIPSGGSTEFTPSEDFTVQEAFIKLHRIFGDTKTKYQLIGMLENLHDSTYYEIGKALIDVSGDLALEIEVEYTKEEVAEVGKDYINDDNLFKLSDILEKINRLYDGEKSKLELIKIYDNAENYYYEMGKKVLNGYFFDEDGNACIIYNPKAKWDWFILGGRWDNMLINKDGYRSNIEKLSDLDFDKMYEERESGLRGSYEEAQKDNIYRILYGIKEDETLEEYLERSLGPKNTIPLHALILNGEWYEKGSMGWFGQDDSTEQSIDDFRGFMEEVIENYYDTHTIIIIDCHI